MYLVFLKWVSIQKYDSFSLVTNQIILGHITDVCSCTRHRLSSWCQGMRSKNNEIDVSRSAGTNFNIIAFVRIIFYFGVCYLVAFGWQVPSLLTLCFTVGILCSSIFAQDGIGSTTTEPFLCPSGCICLSSKQVLIIYIYDLPVTGLITWKSQGIINSWENFYFLNKNSWDI